MATTSTKQGWARGGLIFAGTMMMLIGVFQFFVGIAAIVEDSFFVVGPNYTYEIDTTAWGWIHLGIGVLAVVAGFFLFTAATWARVVAIAMASLSAVANFFFIPYYPLWSLLLIALDIFVIWAVATARSVDEFAPQQAAMGTGTAFAGESAQAGSRWPQENVAAGRHYAEDVKPGMGQPATDPAQQARERAEAAARGGTGGGTYTAGPSGVTPPPDEPRQP